MVGVVGSSPTGGTPTFYPNDATGSLLIGYLPHMATSIPQSSLMLTEADLGILALALPVRERVER